MSSWVWVGFFLVGFDIRRELIDLGFDIGVRGERRKMRGER
jgi:hypothetical protein